ncbi:putative proton-dependent oligopeptide transporter family, MFS transporter superfamily [Helianthus anomalus]
MICKHQKICNCREQLKLCLLFNRFRYLNEAELTQRFCVVEVSTILVTFMHGAMHISSSDYANIMTSGMDFLNILANFGGFLGDVKYGHYNIIIVFAFICTLVSLHYLYFLLLCTKIATS